MYIIWGNVSEYPKNKIFHFYVLIGLYLEFLMYLVGVVGKKETEN